MATRKPKEDLSEYWIEYKATGDLKVRNFLLEKYLPLVHYVASRIKNGLPANVEKQDLISYGVFGLIDAIEKYDLEREIKFETYAINRIRGAIIDELRAIDWIPRSVRSKAKEIERGNSELENRLHRQPTEQELADHLEQPVEDLRSSFSQLSTTAVLALDELTSSPTGRADSLTLLDTLSDHGAEDPEGSYLTEEVQQMLARAIKRLGKRELTVLSLYYGEGLTLAEIGGVLGVTESRVCQLHSQSLISLRLRLAEAL